MHTRKAAALAIVLVAGAGAARGQKIEVTPPTVMVDQTATIRVTGLAPGAKVTLEADLVDGAGHSWKSQEEFQADAQGTVDLTQDAPLKGSYRTVSSMGPIWSMRPAERGVNAYLLPHSLGAQTTELHLLEGGKVVASGQLVQTLMADGIQQVQLQGALTGTLFLPPGAGRHPGMLVLGGSEGGAPLQRARWLASHGYAALALAYFRAPGRPQQLENIPLEYFGEALSWLMQRPEVDAKRIGVMGASRGGELALQLGSLYPEIRAVVAYVPANYRHGCFCNSRGEAAWTLRGQPIAWAMPWSGPADLMRATIAVEEIHGPVLMISAGEDGVWPSSDMVHAAAARLRSAHSAYPVVVLNYPHAGHLAGTPIICPAWRGSVANWLNGRPQNLGGTPEGNAESTLDAIPKVLDFLQQSLGGEPSVTGNGTAPASQ